MDFLHGIFWCRCTRICQQPSLSLISLPITCSFRCFTEALTSLEKAAEHYLRSVGARVPTHRRVLYGFTCEIDKCCRTVLCNTYNSPCNFPDITAFDATKKTQFCSTHNGMCKVRKHRRGNRISFEICCLLTLKDLENKYQSVNEFHDVDILAHSCQSFSSMDSCTPLSFRPKGLDVNAGGHNLSQLGREQLNFRFSKCSEDVSMRLFEKICWKRY